MIVGESVGFEALEFIPISDSFGFALEDPFLGKSIFKKLRKKITKVFKPIMNSFRKNFPKFAPILAAAAQALNFIPGLGVAVGAAIAVGGQAMKMHQQRKEVKKATKAEEAAMAAEQAAADKEANAALDQAYTQGEQYFSATLGMPRDKWSALSVEEKTKFFNDATYTANQAAFTAKGITKEQYNTLTSQEQDALVENLQEENLFGLPTWAWIAIGGGGLVVILLIMYALSRRQIALTT